MIDMGNNAEISNLRRVGLGRLRGVSEWYRWHESEWLNYLAEILLAAFAIADFLFAAALA